MTMAEDEKTAMAAEIAQALTAGDNDLNETLGGWLNMGNEGPLITGTFEDAETEQRYRWRAVVTVEGFEDDEAAP
jgi:hypothetical protein